jgi:hypothetical protein
MTFKSVFKRFATSWWLSPACALGCALVSAAANAAMGAGLKAAWVGWAWMPGLALAVLFGLLSLAVAARWAWKRSWMRALGTMLALGTATVLGGCAFTGTLFLMLLFVEDRFADNLAIPDGIEISDPAPYGGSAPARDPTDPYYAAVAAAVAVPGTGDATIAAEVPSLARLAAEHRDLLLRYLCMHPAWRVFEQRGKLCATRTMRQDGEWRYPLHGYQNNWLSGEDSRWQTRLTIGFPDPWIPDRTARDRFAPGETGKVEESLVVIDAGNACLEIFEQSGATERRIAKALLRLVEDELRPLADAPTEETLRALLPPDAISRGEPGIALRNSFQGGLYDATFRANPGEPGLAWLKAFEVTQGTPLSVARLAEYSNVRLGWSSDPSELFTGVATFTIYEGDWGQYYAARFELWFRPDSGAPERKLAERTFKIQGWMR